MSSFHGQESDTALLAGTGDLSNEYELKQILSVASAYLDAGQVADAEDLLQEAIDADADHPGVQELARRLAHVRGVPELDPDFSGDIVLDVAPDVLLHFTSPLPDEASQSPSVQRLARAGEQYFNSNKIYSALDLTHVLCAEAADYLPAFVRLAEIQIALGNVHQARDIYDNLRVRYEIDGEQAPPLVQSLGISLNPGDTTALVGYAQSLIEAGDVAAMDPFVPEAITRAIESNAEAAHSLALGYVEQKLDDERAQRLYLQVAAASTDLDDLIDAARNMVKESSPLDLLVIRMSAEIVAEDGNWLHWLEQVLNILRQSPDSVYDAQRHLQDTSLRDSLPEVLLARALMLNACQRWHESLELLDKIDSEELHDPAVLFAALYTQAIALDQAGSPVATEAYLQAAQTAYAADVEDFAAQTTLFGISAAPADILRQATVDATGRASIDALINLRDANPARLDIRVALADAHLSAGNVFEGLKELRFVAEEQEKAGNLAGMLDSMRRISYAVPNNIEMKAKLIEGYLRRGILDEAVDELERIGTLYESRNRSADAVSAYVKAAEVTAALGEFVRGNELFGRAVEVDSDDVPVRHAAVAFYLQTGSIDQAAEQLRQVVRIALNAEDKDEAVAALHQIIALAPQDPGAYHSLGEVLTSLGEYTQAERVYRRLASFTPNDPVLEAKQSALAVLAATH